MSLNANTEDKISEEPNLDGVLRVSLPELRIIIQSTYLCILINLTCVFCSLGRG
jgi:hypothetical protein